MGMLILPRIFAVIFQIDKFYNLLDEITLIEKELGYFLAKVYKTSRRTYKNLEQ